MLLLATTMNSQYRPLNTQEDVVASQEQPLEGTVEDESSTSLSYPNHPPCYCEAPTNRLQEASSSCSMYHHGPPTNPSVDALPSYENATKLPTYDEVEKQKEDEARMDVIDAIFGMSSSDSEDDEPRLDGILVGSDCMFFFAFFIGFFFNWVGLFIGYFFMFNLAGRYGAITGFGTSMIKWLIYLRYSDCCQDISIKSNVYVYMLMNLTALLIIFKGVHSWLRVRPYMYNYNDSTIRRRNIRN